MTNAYLATTHAIYDPVTLVARDLDEAFRLFHLWRGTHAPDMIDAVALIAPLPDQDLADQPQLAAVVEIGRVGVAWWAAELGGWTVGTADDDALGEIVPPAPPVRCFVFGGTVDASGR